MEYRKNIIDLEIFTKFINGFVENAQTLKGHPPSPLYTGGLEEIKINVPDKSGIYAIFRKDNKKCFYVGSSINSIRDRLVTHYVHDVKIDYRKQLGQLQNPENFSYWYSEIACPSALNNDRQGYKCLIAAVESMCSAAWYPEVYSKKF